MPEEHNQVLTMNLFSLLDDQTVLLTLMSWFWPLLLLRHGFDLDIVDNRKVPARPHFEHATY